MTDRKPGRWPSPAILISLLAIVLALTGTATAAGVIKIKKPSQLATGVVQSRAIADKGVGTKELLPSALGALDGKPGARGPDGARGPAGPVGEKGIAGDGASTLWAVVEPNGGAVRKTSHVEDTFNLTTPSNKYEINFDRNVSLCEYGVTVDGSTSPFPGRATVNRALLANDKVIVFTYNAAGSPARLGFNVVVDCPT
ncbi:MAG TPA: collagen-like protein [Thermoleophilaceae bacterium]